MFGRSKYPYRATSRRAQIEAHKHERTLLPSAREIFAVRLQTSETRTDKRGRTSVLSVTQPWPAEYSREDLLNRLVAAGLR
jgi:hypothetical protein